MPTYKFHITVTGPLEQVYEHVTGFTDGGPANLKSLEEKHGELVEQEGEIYIFKGASEDDPTWRCEYEHPSRRVMRAYESKWADRNDLFESADDSTLWTVEWQPSLCRGHPPGNHPLSGQNDDPAPDDEQAEPAPPPV